MKLVLIAAVSAALLSSCSNSSRGMSNFRETYPNSEISRVPDTNWAVVRKPDGEIRLVLSTGFKINKPYYDIKIMDPMKPSKKEK